MQHILQTCHYVYDVWECVWRMEYGVWCVVYDVHTYISGYPSIPRDPSPPPLVYAFALATFHRFFPSLLVSSGATYSFFFLSFCMLYIQQTWFYFFSIFIQRSCCCFWSNFYYFSMLKTRRRIKLVFLLLQDTLAPSSKNPLPRTNVRCSLQSFHFALRARHFANALIKIEFLIKILQLAGGTPPECRVLCAHKFLFDLCFCFFCHAFFLSSSED